jgi:DNA-binding MarR family transcriptional regulator
MTPTGATTTSPIAVAPTHSRDDAAAVATPAQIDTWRAFTAMRRQLDREIERRLQAASGISAADFDVLSALVSTREGRRRNGDLAELLGWERSRLSHQVTRMAARDLLERTECADDLRGTWVGVTPGGRAVARGAAEVYRAALAELFFGVLDGDDEQQLGDVAHRVLERLLSPACHEAAVSLGSSDDACAGLGDPSC